MNRHRIRGLTQFCCNIISIPVLGSFRAVIYCKNAMWTPAFAMANASCDRKRSVICEKVHIIDRPSHVAPKLSQIPYSMPIHSPPTLPTATSPVWRNLKAQRTAVARPIENASAVPNHASNNNLPLAAADQENNMCSFMPASFRLTH